MGDFSTEVNAQATSEDFEFAALQAAKNYRRSLVAEFSPYLRGRILEVGAGIGQMTRELMMLSHVKSIDALEPDARFYRQLLKLNPEVRCLHGTLSQREAVDLYDGIISVNVLEHIEDHFEELKRIRLHLSPNGKLCLFVPAFQEIYAPIDQSFGHFRRYRKPELKELLRKAGFRIIQAHYYNSLGFFAWWWNFCVLKKSVFEVNKVKFYDKYLFPIVHFAEKKLARPPLGQSVLVIAEAD